MSSERAWTGSRRTAAGSCKRRPSSGGTSRWRSSRPSWRNPSHGAFPLIDEAVAFGLVGQAGDVGVYRFVHALTRDAVEASLTTADRAALHRAVAEATEAHYARDLSEHLAAIAGHWAELVPYGEAAAARDWAVRGQPTTRCAAWPTRRGSASTALR